jgi:hypothetical protein
MAERVLNLTTFLRELKDAARPIIDLVVSSIDLMLVRVESS